MLRLLVVLCVSVALATEFVQCGDSQYGCKKGTTCCTSGNDHDEWLCCPFEDGVCCNDVGGHCCPIGYPVCDIKHKTCKDHLQSQIPAPMRLNAVEVLKIERRVENEYLVRAL